MFRRIRTRTNTDEIFKNKNAIAESVDVQLKTRSSRPFENGIFFSPVPPPSTAVRTWFVASRTAACYPVGVPVRRARVSKHGDICVHYRRLLNDNNNTIAS